MERNVDDIIKLVDGARWWRPCGRSVKKLTSRRPGLIGWKVEG